MYAYGPVSIYRLETCHWIIQYLMHRVMAKQKMDISIACGERNEEEQEKAFFEGKSNAHYPKSAHNGSPSLAVDAVPYPQMWDEDSPFDQLEELIWDEWNLMCAEKPELFGHYELVSGHDWDGDGIPNEDEVNSKDILQDRPHWEIRLK